MAIVIAKQAEGRRSKSRMAAGYHSPHFYIAQIDPVIEDRLRNGTVDIAVTIVVINNVDRALWWIGKVNVNADAAGNEGQKDRRCRAGQAA